MPLSIAARPGLPASGAARSALPEPPGDAGAGTTAGSSITTGHASVAILAVPNARLPVAIRVAAIRSRRSATRAVMRMATGNVAPATIAACIDGSALQSPSTPAANARLPRIIALNEPLDDPDPRATAEGQTRWSGGAMADIIPSHEIAGGIPPGGS